MAKSPPRRDIFVASPEEIRAGRTTDVYILRTLEILRKVGKDREPVVAEVSTGSLPHGWPWGVLCGLEEAVRLLEGKGVSLWAIPEGSLFPAKTPRGIPVPVIVLEGPYAEWAIYETPLLGMICQASGIATKAARIRKVAKDRDLPHAIVAGADRPDSICPRKTISRSFTTSIPIRSATRSCSRSICRGTILRFPRWKGSGKWRIGWSGRSSISSASSLTATAI